MTTTELIDFLKKHECGGATGRPREITLIVNGTFMPNPHFYVDSTDDGLYTGICIGVSGETAQEQRVLTLDEVKKLQSIRDGAIWMEILGIGLFPALPEFSNKSLTFFVAILFDGYRSVFENDWYGKTWRCWSARPTDEQRRAVKWDD